MTRISRRRFLKVGSGGVAAAKVGGIAGILATGKAPAYAQQSTVHWLRWNDFVPAADQIIREKLVPEAEKALGIKINFERVNGNDLQPRITSAIQSGAGPDIIMLFNNHPHLYAASCVDVSDLADEIGKAQNGFYNVSRGNCSIGDKWISMPFGIVGAMNAYRKSWFEEVGASGPPKTWDEYREIGKKLKAKNRPFGQALGQSFGDPPTFAYPLMWAFGGMEVDDSGKVVINSKETIEAVKFMTAMWKDAFDEGGLAWDDASNNRAFLSGSISCALNGASIYIESLRKPAAYQTEKGAPIHGDILHFDMPAGPAGQFAFHTFQSHVIPTYSKNQKAAKEFLKWFHTAANYERWFVTGKGFYSGATASWEKSKMWDEDKVMEPYRIAGKAAQTPGYKGPPNAKAAEVLSKYLIVNMFASAIKGQTPEAVVQAADVELKKIYG